MVNQNHCSSDFRHVWKNHFEFYLMNSGYRDSKNGRRNGFGPRERCTEGPAPVASSSKGAGDFNKHFGYDKTGIKAPKSDIVLGAQLG